MELRQLGELLGLENRTVRYVIEQRLVPNLALNPGRGSRRVLTKTQAKKVAMAAQLHCAGFRSDRIRDMVQAAAGRLARWEEEIHIPEKVNGLTCVQSTISMAKVYELLR